MKGPKSPPTTPRPPDPKGIGRASEGENLARPRLRDENPPARCRCGHPAGWHPTPGTKSAANGFGCLECSCRFDAAEAAANPASDGVERCAGDWN